jgi:hypothetical protein
MAEEQSRSLSTPTWQRIVGWSAVSISTLVAGFWGFWGSIENFHEGWFWPSLWRNLALMFVQYLSPMIIIVGLSAIAVRWRRAALPIFGAIAVAVVIFFHGANAPLILIAIPMVVVGALYHFGRPEPRRWALRSVIGLPLLTAIVCGAYPGWRAIHRFDDGNYGARLIEGNGVVLMWAPAGPGWPSHYASWTQAQQACASLTADGRSISDKPQNLWRLPTVDEAVRSLVYRGRNAGGVWDPALRRAQYRVMPDKDSPLWNVHSQVIYWWTGTEEGQDKAYRISYNGYVFALDRRGWGDYWAYRCVSEPRH